jgi:cytoskeletal protein CcmA (bactofilin family)
MFGRRKRSLDAITHLADGCELDGTLSVKGDLEVAGTIRGSITVTGDLLVLPTGTIEGEEVKAKNVVLHGRVKANVMADECLSISQTARLEGDAIAGSLNIEQGAFYAGHIVTRDAKALPIARSVPRLVGRREE